MKKDPLTFIGHMLECVDLIQEYTAGKKEDDFLDSEFLQDAVIRRIEIIGEAAKHIPEEIKKTYSQVAWKKIVGMRDKLIHEYFGIDLKLAWDVVQTDLPELKKQLLNLKEVLLRK